MEGVQVEEMEGVEMTENRLLTEDEETILEVYDRLEELQLEIALLKAHGILSREEFMDASEQDINTAQQDLLKSKAAYRIRNNVIESVLISNPILKAVHGGKNATFAEQDLTPLVHQRDEVSITLTKLSTKLVSTWNELRNVESEHMVVARQNAELATTMLALAEEADTKRKDDVTDPKARQQLDELEGAMRTSRQRWRIMKETASATVTGSGIDWARDPKLLAIVLDEGADG